jgi:general secretion pathway protein B
MSYILDALRKAERERDAAQIPTLTTVHDAPAAPSRRIYWIISASVIVCAILLVGIGIFLPRSSPEPDASKPPVGAVAKEAGTAPTPDRKDEVPSDLVTPPQMVERKAPSAASSGIGAATDVKHASRPRQDRKEPEATSPVTKEPIRPQIPTTAPSPETSESSPSAAPPPSKALSLNEAMAKMNMTILFYAEAKSERMVFIDGSRYTEGDYVDGSYLIESITPEGAWLSYQGNQAILRPKAK